MVAGAVVTGGCTPGSTPVATARSLCGQVSSLHWHDTQSFIIRRAHCQPEDAWLFRDGDLIGEHKPEVQALVTRHDPARTQLSRGGRRYGRAAVPLLFRKGLAYDQQPNQ